jgi:hypothetical protein
MFLHGKHVYLSRRIRHFGRVVVCTHRTFYVSVIVRVQLLYLGFMNRDIIVIFFFIQIHTTIHTTLSRCAA